MQMKLGIEGDFKNQTLKVLLSESSDIDPMIL